MVYNYFVHAVSVRMPQTHDEKIGIIKVVVKAIDVIQKQYIDGKIELWDFKTRQQCLLDTIVEACKQIKKEMNEGKK